jgi:hypothetical protein
MDKNINSEPDEISLKELLLKLKSAIAYLKTKWILIVFCGIIGGLLGFVYASYKKPLYIATSTFVLEDSKGGGLGQYAGLASLAGIDISGGGAGGIFQGDNIMELYRSRVMLEKTLLSPVVIGGKKQLLIERYINFNKLRDQWKEKDHITNINFNGDSEKFNRKQDSIISDLVGLFRTKILGVDKIDKKLNILKVDVATNDELFCKEFNNKLVETVNNFYTETKTKKSSQNVMILQKQADSVKRVLNSSIGGVASAIDAAPNANPSLVTLRVPSQRKQVDVQANSAIYGEIVKNLEVSKISLRQETPLIQVIDRPVLPLFVNRLSKLKGFIVGGFLGCFLIIFVISIRKIFKTILN